MLTHASSIATRHLAFDIIDLPIAACTRTQIARPHRRAAAFVCHMPFVTYPLSGDKIDDGCASALSDIASPAAANVFRSFLHAQEHLCIERHFELRWG